MENFRHIIFTFFGLLFCLQTALSQVDDSTAFEIEILYRSLPNGEVTSFTFRNNEIVFNRLRANTTDTNKLSFVPLKDKELMLHDCMSDSVVALILSTDWNKYGLIEPRSGFDGYRIWIRTSIGSEQIEARLGLYQDAIIRGLIEYALNSIPNKNVRKRYQVHFE